MSAIFFSQQGEDLFVSKKYINKKNDTGVFVEVGALDGITYSNTAFLEKYFGFSGILIEPSPSSFNDMKKTRPSCVHVNKAISSTMGEAVFRDNWAMSGILENLSEVHRNNSSHGTSMYSVPTIPLDHVLHENEIKYIDFMSIDVEGGELEVLKSMDWNIPIYVICIELDGHNAVKDEECRKMLTSNGFRLDKRLNINEFWVNDSYFRKDELFDENTPFVDWKNVSSLEECGRFLFMEPSAIPSIQEAIFNE